MFSVNLSRVGVMEQVTETLQIIFNFESEKAQIK